MLMAATMGTSFVAQVLLGRRFGPAGLGEYHATTLFVIALTTVGFGGLAPVVTERLAHADESAGDTRDVAGTTLVAIVVVGAMLALVAWVAWPVFASVTRLSDPVGPAWVAAAAAGSVLISGATSFLMARLNVLRATAVALAQPAAVLAGLVLERTGTAISGSELAIVGVLASGAAGAIVLARELLSGVKIRLGAVASLLKPAVFASTTLYPTFFATWLERALIGALLGPSALGAYAAASAPVEAVSRIAKGIGTFSIPAYARLEAEGLRGGRVFESHLRVIAAFLLVAAAVLMTTGPALLRVLFGPGFSLADTTLRLLAVALVPYGLVVTFSGNVLGTQRAPQTARVLVALVPVHASLVVAGARSFAIAGVALVSAITWTVVAVALSAPWSERGLVRTQTAMRVAVVTGPIIFFSWVVGAIADPVLATAAGLASSAIGVVALLGEADRQLVARVLHRGSWRA